MSCEPASPVGVGVLWAVGLAGSLLSVGWVGLWELNV